MKKLFFTVMATALMLAGATNASAQVITLSGTVSDLSSNPISGVVVHKKNSSIVTTTDNKGYYTISVNKSDFLVFSHPNYKSREFKVTSGGKFDVTLQHGNIMKFTPPRVAKEAEINHEDRIKSQADISMNEVTVTGYQTERRQSLTGAVSTVSAEQIARVPRTRYTGERHSAPTVAKIAVQYDYNGMNNEDYANITENRFTSVSKDPLSTFSLEVDGASYSNTRRMINQGHLPPSDAVRVEEFLNYFSYNYEKPRGNDPLKINYEVGVCPWNNEHRLVRIGVKAKEIPSENLPVANFVFLVDVSGSMESANRLPLVKSSLKLLVNNLRDKDRVAIVAYAGAAGEVLPSTSGADKQKIREALDNLSAGGSTAGGAGIQLAYKVARQNFIKGGNNRIILATDGDFNVGINTPGGLEKLIEEERKSGVFLTVLAYGMGNYRDKMVQTLAEKGNGNHAYIDNLQEANKVLVSEFGGTMYTVAKDVKLQLEFNPAKVQSFRLVGYESRLLAHEDFNDDTKDAGEIGAGHTVTALYEIVPVGISGRRSIDPLKYQPNKDAVRADIQKYGHPDLLTVKLRYKAPEGNVSKLMEVPIIDSGRDNTSADFRFASAAAMFAQLLRNSDFKGNATYDDVIRLAQSGLGEDPQGYRREFIRLAETAKGMCK